MVTGNKENIIYYGLDPTRYSADQFLFLLVAEGALTWAVADTSKSVLSIGEYQFGKADKKEALAKFFTQTIGSTDFSQVKIALRSCDMVLVPNAFYDYSHAARLLKLSSGVDYTKVSVYSIARLSATLVYGFDHPFEEQVNSHIKGEKVLPSQGLLLDTLLKNNRFDRVPQMVMDIYGKKCDIMVVGHSKVYLVNSFEFKTNEDILFYAANTIKQLELENEEISIEVCGEVSDVQLELFREYFENVSLFTSYDAPVIQFEFESSIRFSTLLNMVSCAS